MEERIELRIDLGKIQTPDNRDDHKKQVENHEGWLATTIFCYDFT